MDRKLSEKEQSGGKIKTILKYGILIGLIAGAIYGFRSLIKQKGKKSDFHISSVERGDIESTISASGIVVPAFEREINAPVATEIKSVSLSTGSEVKAGDLIMELDQEFTKLTFEQMKDELDLRKNSIEKLKLKYDKDLRDLDYRDQIKALEVEELVAEVSDQKRLLDIGGATAEELEQAQLKLKVAKLEKKMLENELEYSRNVNVNEKKGLELEYTIQEKKLKELRKKLSDTRVKAPQSGVITWINEDIGRTVNEGETLVRIANLGNYTIEASSSDRNTQKINIGQEARVRIGSRNLKGHISRILPAVENNTIQFHVKLEDEGSSVLRPNLRAEVFVITGKKDNVLRVRNGAALRGSDQQEIFVVRGNKAIKLKIRKGLTNSDFVEILDNVKQGDKIITSNVDAYIHLDEFEIEDK